MIFWGVYYKNIVVKSQEYLYKSFLRIVTYAFPLSASPTNSTWNMSSYVLSSSHGIITSNKTCVMRISQFFWGWINNRIQRALTAKLDPQQ